MSNETKPLKSFADEDAMLDWVTDKQVRVVEELLTTASTSGETNPGGGITNLQNSDKSLLVSMLDGMSRTALTKKRIKSDEAAAAGLASSATGLIANLLKAAQGVSFGRPAGEVIDMCAPTLGKEVPDPILLPGETEIGVAQGLSYETFMNTRKAA